MTAFFDTVILSDLHLGSEVSRADAALNLLRNISFKRLILLGDIFCDLNFRRLKKDHWRFLGYIRKLSNPKRAVEVVWVEGNHDYGLTEVMSHLVGVEVYQEYEWEYRGMRHLAVHGHQFDRLISTRRLVNRALIAFHEWLQKFSFGRQRIVGFLERFDTIWLRLSSRVATGALVHARSRNVHRVFCGHTHEALQQSRDGVEYFNTGSWTQRPATYVTIDADGVSIRQYEEEATQSGSGNEAQFDNDLVFATA